MMNSIVRNGVLFKRKSVYNYIFWVYAFWWNLEEAYHLPYLLVSDANMNSKAGHTKQEISKQQKCLDCFCC